MLPLFLLVVALVLFIVAVQANQAKATAEQQVKVLSGQVQQSAQTASQLASSKGQVASLEARLASYLSLEAEKAKALAIVQEERQKISTERSQMLHNAQSDRQRLEQDAQRLDQKRQETIAQLRTINEAIQARSKELTDLENSTDVYHFGFYESHFDFSTSSAYQARLDQVREQQKAMLSNKIAVSILAPWEVNGSKIEGRRQAEQLIRLVLRAFNGECDASIARVRYNNVLAMETRIRKAYEAINSYTHAQKVHITPEYLDLKTQELRLAHEYQEKLQIEKEEQRRIREQMREEEIARRELERAQAEAEKEEARAAQALQKARIEIASLVGEKQRQMQEQIGELERRLQEAQSNKARAVAQAQLTKMGHVYVISNIGSFGENVFKIGMTRRLTPEDRIQELGGASVPFLFDIHAMIWSEDAPALEAKLHRAFHHRRVNGVNERREFFRVSLAEIAQVVKSNCAEIEFAHDAEAKEYRQTLAMQGVTP